MARLVFLDYETFYSKEYSLTRMGTEEYIMDPRFEAHGAAVWTSDGVRQWMWDHELRSWLRNLDWSQVILGGMNLKFDAAILAWVYGHYASFYIDVMALGALHIKPYTGRVSLDRMAEYCGLPLKSGALENVKGLSTMEIMRNPQLAQSFEQYALQDNDNAVALFRRYWPATPRPEQLLMDWTVKTWLYGRLELDVNILQENLADTLAERQVYLDLTGIGKSDLRSTAKFAAKLDELGIDVEYKPGKRGEVPAVARSDDFMRDLLSYPDPHIQFCAQGRLAWSSSLEVTRTERFIRHAQVMAGCLHVPLVYGAAHTLRFGGGEKLNLQNLGRRSKIRKAIKAPKGKKLVIVDASQIECRLVAWISRCQGLLTSFRNGSDPYCDFGSGMYHYELTPETTPFERQVSKVAVLQLGYQSGPPKLQKSMEVQALPISLESAEDIVHYYRRVAFPEISRGWYLAEKAMVRAVEKGVDEWWGGCLFTPVGIMVSSGGWLIYPELQSDGGVLSYWSSKYGMRVQLYGGKIFENICQRTARDIITETHIRFLDEVVLQVHDELVLVTPEDEAQLRLKQVIESMSTAPEWIKGIPLAAEGRVADVYAK